MSTAGTTDDPESEVLPTSRVSEEEPSSGEDVRPELSAESLSPLGRLALAFLTFVGALVTLAGLIAALARPEAIYGLGAPGIALVAGLVSLIWMLQILFGALLENNRALGVAAHRMWMAAFVLTGPFGILLYWFLHVWPAPRLPHREGVATPRRREAPAS